MPRSASAGRVVAQRDALQRAERIARGQRARAAVISESIQIPIRHPVVTVTPTVRFRRLSLSHGPWPQRRCHGTNDAIELMPELMRFKHRR